ncbi:hypothetical protein INR49_007394 [Caranx melampygus]|nr:hypothetical protein INR49_007394 [Caranx melampygus]
MMFAWNIYEHRNIHKHQSSTTLYFEGRKEGRKERRKEGRSSQLRGSQFNTSSSSHTLFSVLLSYYSLEDISHESINKYLSSLVQRSLRDLECSYCIEIKEDDCTIEPLTYGRISSYYYLRHQTIRMFKERLKSELSIPELLSVLTDAEEYAELPVRHNEDQLNSQLAQQLPLQVNPHSYDSAHTKTHLLLQAHFSHAQLPCSDYGTDTKTVLDNAIRICQSITRPQSVHTFTTLTTKGGARGFATMRMYSCALTYRLLKYQLQRVDIDVSAFSGAANNQDWTV